MISSAVSLRRGVAHSTFCRKAPAAVVLSLVALLSACQPADEAQPAPAPIRPVRVVSVEEHAGGETATLTGTIQAEEDVALSFRIGGRLLDRLVNVGDTVTAGQLVARIDESTWRDSLQAARANLAAAMGRVGPRP